MSWKIRFVWLFAMSVWLAPMTSGAATLADIDRAFVCPEILPDQAARNAAMPVA